MIRGSEACRCDGAEEGKDSGRAPSCEAQQWQVLQSVSGGDWTHQRLCCSASQETGSAQSPNCPSTSGSAARPAPRPCF